jgi:DNA repair photolyase
MGNPMQRIQKGRGATKNTPNRFEQVSYEPLPFESDAQESDRGPRTLFLRDSSRTILARNDSPDIPFTYSINPYRGCEHGCIYCYARPSHEYLGFSAGLDFETRILVKMDAPALLEEAFRKKTWNPQMVCFSGNTDCYQPIERSLQLTRRCLEVFLRFRNPVGIVTKNFLVTRDVDILRELARLKLGVVAISITSLDEELIRTMEPRTSASYKRFEAIDCLVAEGIPVHVNVSPIIPGLNDEEIPSIVRKAAARGAQSASVTMIRLPGPVRPLFVDWIQRAMPERARKILNRIQDIRGGTLNDNRWNTRMKGEGEIAQTITRLFEVHCARYGLNQKRFEFDTSLFRRPPAGQADLFP